MASITERIKIDAPIDRVWAAAADLGGIDKYNPIVTKSYYTSEARGGMGASRHCDLLPSGTVEERVIDWEEGREYTLDVFEGTVFLMKVMSYFIMNIKLASDGEGTIVTETVEFGAKGGLLGSILDLFLKAFVRKMSSENLIGLKHYVETSEVITPEVFKRVKKAA
jgi:hypothetical protein